MYRPIVHTTMRQQVISTINAPRYCSLQLNSYGYSVSMAFHITKEMYEKITSGNYGRQVHVFSFRGKYYIKWSKSYQYSLPFFYAFEEAFTAKQHLKIVMREVKQAVLQDEIDLIRYAE